MRFRHKLATMRTPRRALVGLHSVGRWRAKSTFSEHLARRDIANPFQGLPALEATIGRSIVARIGSSSLSQSPPIHHPSSFSRRHSPSFSRAHCARDEHPHRACGRAHGACMHTHNTFFQTHGQMYTCRHTCICMYICMYHVATHVSIHYSVIEYRLCIQLYHTRLLYI